MNKLELYRNTGTWTFRGKKYQLFFAGYSHKDIAECHRFLSTACARIYLLAIITQIWKVLFDRPFVPVYSRINYGGLLESAAW